VICVEASGRHVMLAGDVTDTLDQRHARRADAIGPDPKAHVPVFVPSHDRESAARLAAGSLVAESPEAAVR
jgi:hypothetical protein